MDASPALVIQLHGLPAAGRDRLVALLSEYDLTAVQEDDISSPSVWIAHFSSAANRDAASGAIRDNAELGSVQVESTVVEDDDWARRTQADLPAIRVGRVIVAPPWDLPNPEPQVPSPEPRAPDIVVIIEPSRGFGTGHHQSTRLCLALLQHRSLGGQTVLDVGTGSGVLAIAAAKLGAAYVAAIDVDPDAVENARENIATNGVAAVVEAHVEDFTTAGRQPADVVTANLSGTILARHAKDLVRFVRPTGALIVAGFNIEEKAMVEEAFPDFAIGESAEEEGWWAFVLTRASA